MLIAARRSALAPTGAGSQWVAAAVVAHTGRSTDPVEDAVAVDAVAVDVVAADGARQGIGP